LPLDFAEAISELEAVLPMVVWEDAFLGDAPAEESAVVFAGAAAAAGVEVPAGAELAVGAADADFLLLVVEAGVSAMADELAGVVDCIALSLAAAFLLLRLVFDAVASDELAAGVDWSVAVVLAEAFELDFFLLVLGEVPPAEVSELAPVSDVALDFCLLVVDLPLAEEVSAAEPELDAASDFALFVDFLLEDLLLVDGAD
jgi:hypothetical protein